MKIISKVSLTINQIIRFMIIKDNMLDHQKQEAGTLLFIFLQFVQSMTESWHESMQKGMQQQKPVKKKRMIHQM